MLAPGGKGISDIHDRMPDFEQEEEYDMWLGSNEPAFLKELLKPYSGDMVAYPVSSLANSPKSDNA